MKGKKKKIIVILGPTASGKSDLAIQLAKLFNGEIISADSRQVYKGMNLGTGKVEKDKKPKNQYYSQGVKHYLLDIVSPKKYFSLADFLKLADKAVKEIFKKGKLPIICGGTGLYISALIEGWQLPKVKPNKRLREKLGKKSKEELFQLLKDLDPQKAKKIDKNNRPRLIRAIEIASILEKVPALVKKPPDWDILIIGIKKDRQELKNLISQRLEKRLNLGMISEVKNLKKQGVSSQRLEGFGLEYRFLNRYLEEKISFEEMKKQLLKEINNYAKRQMTWFRKIKNVHWVEKPEKAVDLTKKFLNEKG